MILRGQYGVMVFALSWIPGLIAVAHMLAFYRLTISNDAMIIKCHNQERICS